MIDVEKFKDWLRKNTSYTDKVVSNIASRAKRADEILPYEDTETYLYYIEKQDAFKSLSVSVRSQLRKAVKLYTQYRNHVCGD